MIDVLKKCVGLKRVRSYFGCCIVCIDYQLFYDMSKLHSLPNWAKFGRWFRFSAIVLLGWKRRKSWIHSIANISMGRSWSPLSGRLGCPREDVEEMFVERLKIERSAEKAAVGRRWSHPPVSRDLVHLLISLIWRIWSWTVRPPGSSCQGPAARCGDAVSVWRCETSQPVAAGVLRKRTVWLGGVLGRYSGHVLGGDEDLGYRGWLGLERHRRRDWHDQEINNHILLFKIHCSKT